MMSRHHHHQHRHHHSLWLLLLSIILSCGISNIKADGDENAMSMAEIIELIEPFGKSCNEQPEREHIVEMLQNREDAAPQTKCFRQCLLQLFELMPEGEMQFDEDKTVEMMNMMFSDKEDDSRRIINGCNKEHSGSTTDACEAAHVISMCMLREMRKSDFNIPEIEE